LSGLVGFGERVAAPCPHFGACGGCQLQDVAYAAQLAAKRERLAALLSAAGLRELPEIRVHAGEAYGYRNRIRLRVLRVGDAFALGYNAVGGDPMAISTCLIAAPELWAAAQALPAAAKADRDAAAWFAAASEVELFANDALSQMQLTLLCAPRTKLKEESFARAFAAFQSQVPELVGAGAVAADPRTGPTGRVLASAGAAGLMVRVGQEAYWVTRGGFFQVNRFLVERLVQLVADGRSGALAWDLYAGVGLFSRVLARSFARVTAVEANTVASADNRAALAKIGSGHRAETATTVEFLRRAVVERERPELVVLDPPRAGAGLEACALLVRLRPRTVV